MQRFQYSCQASKGTPEYHYTQTLTPRDAIAVLTEGAHIIAVSNHPPTFFLHLSISVLPIRYTFMKTKTQEKIMATTDTNTIRLHLVLRATPDRIYRAFLDGDA